MIKLSFPTIKLGKYIKEVKCKVKNTDLKQDDLIVYGVTNTEGITVTNNKASDDLSNYTVLNENQFAYNPYRVNVGSIGLSTTGTFGVVSPAYVVFEATKEISSEFLLYYLKSDLGINLIKWYGDRGGVRSALRFADLKEIDFPDIDFEKQLSILGKMKEIDNKLSEFNKNLSIENVSSLRQAILQQAVEGKLCEQDPADEPASVLLEKIKAEKEKLIAEKKIKKQKELPPIADEEKPFDLPQGWDWCRLGNITQSISTGPFGSMLHKSDYVADGIPLVNPKNIVNSSIVIDSEMMVSSKTREKLSSYVLNTGDLVIGRRGEMGRCALVKPEQKGFLCGTGCFFISFEKNINLEFILKIFTSPFIIQKLKKESVGATMNNLNHRILNELNFPLPPLAEQQRIVEKVDRLMALCDELEQEVTSAKKYASQLMEAVLQEAFSNKPAEAKDNVLVFAPQPQQTTHPKPLLAAARGKMSEATWQRITEEAIKLASEEN